MLVILHPVYVPAPVQRIFGVATLVRRVGHPGIDGVIVLRRAVPVRGRQIGGVVVAVDAALRVRTGRHLGLRALRWGRGASRVAGPTEQGQGSK